ncbi:MAG: gamma-glutamyl-gamma-aminobutyrate hydrolase family protein [Nitrosopumilus sp.]|uniref:type 1 glutamine amidotransferase n=1 Tax=Nitrosopumilus sp. TaxID=2024843 RepID=UPI00247C3046|nr:gamma-glutamyl-gamma-aminobutyrate hydrolase family protein [Nitrosopumilus sp.]MCV0393619.1 gamma-glutamyl-gamma-aminobutyrate hydrolase family protein [Nitrosopumilus sp.]
MLLVLDNGSLYTKNLISFLEEKNFKFEKHTPDLFDLNSIDSFNSIILSGRRINEKKTNKVNSKIINYSVKNNIKLLGICYGAEIMALTLGGTIRKIPTLQKGNETIQIIKDNPISNNSIKVYESHSFEISKLPKELIVLGQSHNCKYEIIQYSGKPIFGTQFHPEMSQDGCDLIEKFCLL